MLSSLISEGEQHYVCNSPDTLQHALQRARILCSVLSINYYRAVQSFFTPPDRNGPLTPNCANLRFRIIYYLYKTASVQFCRSKDQLGSQAGVPERQMAGPNPQKGPTNTLELL